MKCQIDLPYPKLDQVVKNPEVARLILHSYAGDISEDTAIHQYLYQSVLLKDTNSEISEILEQISKVEMHHFHYLANLIKKLGVYPVYMDPIVDTKGFWSSKYVAYDRDLCGMLEADIEAEKKAILQYNSLIHVIEDGVVKEALKRIVLDERLHLEILEKLLESVDEN